MVYTEKQKNQKRFVVIVLVLAVLVIVFAVAYSIIFPKASLDAELASALPRLETKIKELQEIGNSQELQDLLKLKMMIESRFRRTGFKPNELPSDMPDSLSKRLKLVRDAIEEEMAVCAYTPPEHETEEEARKYEEEHKHLQKMKEVAERLILKTSNERR